MTTIKPFTSRAPTMHHRFLTKESSCHHHKNRLFFSQPRPSHHPSTRSLRLISFSENPSSSTTTETTEPSTSVQDDVDQSTIQQEELVYTKPSSMQQATASFRLAFALPWRRFKDGSALTMKLSGAIAEQPQSRFSSITALPAICDSLIKAAYDPRIVGLVIKIDPLQCGWGKLLEIRRHIEFFKKSGKFTVAYLERAGEKEYFLATAFDEIYAPPSASLSLRGFAVNGTFLRGVFDKIGVEPEVKRIGEYKSAGDQLMRKDMSDAQREQLTALLDDIYNQFITTVSTARNKTPDEVKTLLDSGVYDMNIFKQDGWITDLKYEDELNDMIKQRTKGKEDELRAVGLRKYSRIGKSAFGIEGGNKAIAIVRTSGAIVPGGNGTGGSSNNITSKSVITQLRMLKKNKRVAAVVLRVDSPGGDALESDLMWREIRKLSEEKPVIASMADVAASGGYYMSMACRKIVAEAITITGSIGVVTAKFNLGELYRRAGYSKETISRGRYAELLSETRPFSDDEAALFDSAAQHAYAQFRNKAAESRGMEIDAMQAVAQGRVWSGNRALDIGLIDAVGGVNKAIAMAKEAAGIKDDEKVRVLEVSRASASPLSLLLGGGGATASVGEGMMRMMAMLGLIVTSAMNGGGSGGGMSSSLYRMIGAPLMLNGMMGGVDAGMSAADQYLMQGLHAGVTMAQLPEVSVDGVGSRALLESGCSGGSLIDINGGDDLFVD